MEPALIALLGTLLGGLFLKFAELRMAKAKVGELPSGQVKAVSVKR